MALIADDLAAWLVSSLADAARRKVIALTLGSDQKRALQAAAKTALQQTAMELYPDDRERAAHVALVIRRVFGQSVPGGPWAGRTTMLEGLAEGIAAQLSVLDDARMTGIRSSAEALGVPAKVAAQKLTGHLVREIIALGSRGGPLFPLADQLNHDMTHLQGQRLEDSLAQLASEVHAALTRLGGSRTLTAGGDLAQAGNAISGGTSLRPVLQSSDSHARDLTGTSAGLSNWLTLGYRGGTPVLSDWHVLTTGLEPGDQQALIAEALMGGPGPAALICQGPQIHAPLGCRVVHYDMTARCREGHAHAAFDPAALPRTASAVAANEMLSAVRDPSWQPPADAGTNFSAYVHPQTWTALPLLSAALWAAGAAGYGVREAMDWLAADQVAEIAAYCRSLAGPNPPPLIGIVEGLSKGPAPARQQATHLAVQTLAPVEAILRNAADATGAQRLDLDAWLSAQAVLAVSLPLSAGVAEQQVLLGLLAGSFEVQRARAARAPSTVWSDVPKPAHENVPWPVVAERALVTTYAAQFRGWANDSGVRRDLLLGSNAQAEQLAVAGAIARRSLIAPPPAQVLLIRNGVVERLSAPTARTHAQG